MAMPIPLFKAARTASAIVDDAETLADACDIEFRELTGKSNVMASRGYDQHPVCCVNRDTAGYWVLECNDRNVISESQLKELASRMRKWENAPAIRG